MATKPSPEQNFQAKAPLYMDRLIARFALTSVDAAAIMGNLGHESLGFTALQEIKPTVKGSLGGYGWAQWTGPRRKDFEGYCKAGGLDPASDEASYGFLVTELAGPYRAAITKLKAATGIEPKVIAFEMAYERAGVKHYDSRYKWAQIAMSAWQATRSAIPVPPVAPVPPVPAPPDVPAPETPPTPSPAPQASLQKVMAAIAGLIAAAVAAILALHR